MTEEQLAEIRKRAEYVVENSEWQSTLVSDLIEEDVPKLLDTIASMSAEVERLRKMAHEILEEYDHAERRVIDEVSTNRKFALGFHEYYIKRCQNEINGVDSDG